jgi:hypothetical protein
MGIFGVTDLFTGVLLDRALRASRKHDRALTPDQWAERHAEEAMRGYGNGHQHLKVRTGEGDVHAIISADLLQVLSYGTGSYLHGGYFPGLHGPTWNMNSRVRSKEEIERHLTRPNVFRADSRNSLN